MLRTGMGSVALRGGTLNFWSDYFPLSLEIFAKVSKQKQNSTRTSAITLGNAQAGQDPGPGEKRACCISL